MSSTRDVNVSMKKRYKDDETLNLYPKTKNIELQDKTNLEEFVTYQKTKNAIYDKFSEKLDTIEVGAQKNQKAISSIKVGSQTLRAQSSEYGVEFGSTENVIVRISGNKIIFDTRVSDIPLASRANKGLMSAEDYSKLAGIEEGANKYIHPESESGEKSFVYVTTDKCGHIISGFDGPLPVHKGGTGKESVDGIKKLLDVRPVLKQVTQDSNSIVESGAIYTELSKKANVEHGNHIPDSSAKPGRLSFLKEGNTWSNIPSATNELEGVVKIASSITEGNKTSTNNPTVKAVYDFVKSVESGIRGESVTTYTTLKAVEDYINGHKKEFNDLQTAVTTGDSKALEDAKTYAKGLVDAVIGKAPGTLDTLEEISAWIDSHETVYEELLTTLSTKANDAEIKELIATKADITEMNKKADATATESALMLKVDKETGKGLSTNDLTNDRVSHYDLAYEHSTASHAPVNAERNIIVGIKKNNVDISPDSERKVNLTIPTKVSDLTNDSGYTKVEKSTINGNIIIDGTDTNVYTHPSGTNPHGTTKSDVGLGNVGNFKAVSTVANQALTDAEKSNARANIGAGISSFSGSYNDLSNKPTIPTVGDGTVTIKQAGVSKGTFTMNQSGNTIIELTDTDTNTWRGIQNNLTSDSTTDSLSAAQGKVLKGLVDGKAASSHTHNYLPLSGGTMTGGLNFANNTWNTVGDDVAIGDHNGAGSLGVKGINGTPKITFVNSSNEPLIQIGSETSSEAYVSNNFNVKGTTMKLNNGSSSIVYNSTTESIDFVFE